MDPDQKRKLSLLARAIGKCEVDYSKLNYHFLEGSVMLTNNGQLVGMMHRGVYDALMKVDLPSTTK